MPRRRAKKTILLGVKLTEAERAQVTRDAGRRSISDYVRLRLFGEDARAERVPPAPRTDTRNFALALTALGQSEIAPSLRSLARSIEAGALPCDEETLNAIRASCAAVMQLRDDLVAALGLREGGRHDP